MPQEQPNYSDDQTCANCYFWDFHSDRDHDSHGVCRRRAPMPATAEREQSQKPFRTTLGDTVWPVTDRADWCGDYKFIGPLKGA